jgi:hypothetical protein
MGMTTTETLTGKTTRPAIFMTGQIITIAPKGGRMFEVVAVSEIDDMIQVEPIDGSREPFWHDTTYARHTDALTRGELTAWLALRGAKGDYLDELVGEYLGKTLDEMDRIHEEMHGPMA